MVLGFTTSTHPIGASRRRSALTFLVALLCAVPSAAHAADAPPEVQALTDVPRCQAGLELDGFDRCETWAVRHAGSVTGPDDAQAIAVSPVDGTVFVTGLMEEGTIAAETTAYDPATGEVLWSAFTGASDNSHAIAVAVAPDGARVYIAGPTMRAGTRSDYLVQALDAGTGALLWTAVYDGPASGFDNPSGLAAVGPNVVVTGISAGSDGEDATTLALDGASGERLWEARFDGPGHFDDRGAAVAASKDGSLVFVAGTTCFAAFPNCEYLTVAYDTATGDQAWASTYSGPLRRDGADAIVASAHSVFVTGTVVGDGGLRYGTVALDAKTGERHWSATYAGAPGGWTTPNAIAVDPRGRRVFVTGGSDNAESSSDEAQDYATVAYDARDGSELWAARYDGPALGKDVAYGVAVTPDGDTVVVTGLSDTGPKEAAPNGPWWDAATIAYEAGSGEQDWIARYNGPLQQADTGYALALSPSGDAAYVAGAGQGAVSTDYLTLAYALDSGPGPDPAGTGLDFVDTAPSGQYSDEAAFAARLTDDDGEPVPDAPVSFTLSSAEGTRTFEATTDGEGVARTTAVLTERPGPAELTVRYAGDPDRLGSSATASYEIAREDTVLDVAVSGKGGRRVLTATLVDADSRAGIGGRTVELFANGTRICSAAPATDSGGRVTCDPEGRYQGTATTYSASFRGDDHYVASDSG